MLVVHIAMLFVLNLLLGTVLISMHDVLSILFFSPPQGETGNGTEFANIICSSRVPQALTALMVGGGLAVCGLQMHPLLLPLSWLGRCKDMKKD